MRILQSCNGLLCCSTSPHCHVKGNYYIYNPTTNQSRILPENIHRKNEGNDSVHAVNFAFGPLKSPYYKVIFVYTSSSLPKHYELEIYSSDTGLWKYWGNPLLADVDFRNGVFWNNWISIKGTSLYFIIEEERVGSMPMLPPIPIGWEKRTLRYFRESQGHLHFVQTHGPQTILFNVYEMERDYSGWVVKYQVDLGVIMDAYPESKFIYYHPADLNYYMFVILSIVQREKDEDSFLVLHLPGKAIVYNFGEESFTKLCDFYLHGSSQIEGSLRFGGWFDAFEYIESLCSV